MMQLGYSLLGLLSKVLGLDRCHLKDMDCVEGLDVLQRTSSEIHQNQWVDVSPIRGALVVNIGDILHDIFHIISNDKFISVEHIVLSMSSSKFCGPIF
uniref:Isopenicillin N synthase-like Fe(2+) 2OG dioxygenase domain-containing protein n=1 Tax=Solanum lycopersicum TaxID=4081 RepID=A0A3Q7G3Q4_SOLLC